MVELRGRQVEQAVLNRLLDDVRAGRSRVLVVRGEAGVGKTALLDYLEERASGCRLVRAVGVESEMELAFAALHQLCAPLIGGLRSLPAPQRAALTTAFGLDIGGAADRFVISVATLGLLCAAADDRPLVCLIDDAQWLDRASAQALGFVARRLLAESVAIVFSVREPDEGPELTGLPELLVEGLVDADARELLDAVVHGRLDARVRERILAETRGNPLAILELPRGFSVAELAGGFASPGTQPLARRIERSFRRQLETLPTETQQLLLAAAAEPVGDGALLWRAAEQLGIPVAAAAPAEAAGLIEFGVRTCFRHPLVRSAAYRAATRPEQRRAHRALAEATDPDVDPDRRAWHRAHAAVGPEDSIADDLERSAGRARARGGVAAAAAFLERAAELTVDPARRSARVLSAAQAKFVAAAPNAADGLLRQAESGQLDELQRARLARLRAQLEFGRRRGSDAPLLLLDAAKGFEGLDNRRSRDTYLEALGAAIFAGRLGQGLTVRQVAEAARMAPPAPGPPLPIDLLLDATVTRFTHGYLAGVTPLRRGLQALRHEAGGNERHNIGWLWTWCPVAPEPIAPDLWDDESWYDLAASAVTLARGAGALAVLPVALSYRAAVHVHAGEFASADALIAEAEAITSAAGNAPLSYTSLLLAAWRGHEADALGLIAGATNDATGRGEGRALGLACHAMAVLYNGLGNYEAALTHAQEACEHDDLGFFGWSLVEVIEAGVRSGARVQAAAALEQLDERTRAAGSEWALGIQARSRALMNDGPSAELLYREAVERLARTRIAVHLARAHLVYGEWLRRVQRRVDAREQLRTAYAMFQCFGADAFAERARRELQATGAAVRARATGSREALTAQEFQVAQLAADGHTNLEIGAQLFISPRTAEYHLHKVYAKLDISSRRQLRRRIAEVEHQLR